MNKSNHALYSLWRGMIQRCHLQSNKDYCLYGGRGIKVCDKWRNDFWAFISDMGEKPSKQHSIDRINNNGDYEPSNCRWATPKQQGKNKRKPINYGYLSGKIYTTELARLSGKSRKYIESKRDTLLKQFIVGKIGRNHIFDEKSIEFARSLMLDKRGSRQNERKTL